MQPEIIANRYRVLRPIGRGGMGTVWLCRDEILEREVAVKQIGALPGEDAQSTTRAMREARVSAAMNHKNAVAVYDVVEHDRGTWLVMEHFPSRTLADLLAAEGPLPPQRVARIGAQVAAALASAHGLGIVHRDVKPGNILVSDDDSAKLSDFGIARGHTDASLTQTGMMTGTPAYFSPELAHGGDPSFASDAWALGATLFTAAEGQPPFPPQDNPLAMLSTITREEPARPELAGPVAPVIEALLQRDPAQRWSMDRVHRELAQVEAGERSDLTRVFAAGAASARPGLLDWSGEGDAAASADAVGADPAYPEDTEDEESREPGVGFTSNWQTTEEPAPVGSADHGRRRGWWVAAVVLLLLVGLGGLAWAALSPEDQTTPQAGGSDGVRQQSSSPPTTHPAQQTQPTKQTQPTTPTSTATTTPAVGAGTKAEAEQFVSTYYTLVPDDLDAGWAELSPEYQDSIGRDVYDDFWNGIASVSVSNVEAVTATQVSYSIVYTRNDGSTSSEEKVITLERSGDSFLIAGDSSAS